MTTDTVLSGSALILILLLIVIAADHLGSRLHKRFVDWKNRRSFVAGHPEMRGISLKNDPLLTYQASAELREFIFDNDEPGEDRPFLSSPLNDLDDIDYA